MKSVKTITKNTKSEIALIGDEKNPVKVCDVINGKPKVKSIVKDDCIEFVLRYSLFHKEVKRYDKITFQEIL